MDRNIFIGIIAATVILVLLLGDRMYVGLWYYLAIPIAAIIVTLFFKPSSFYLTGVGLAVMLTYIPYYWYNMTAARPEGLLALGHLFSLPGLFIGIVLSALYLKNKNKSRYYFAVMGFSATYIGYAANQLIVCNSIIYCGSVLTLTNG